MAVLLSPLIKREGEVRDEGRSLLALEFFYIVLEEVEEDFLPESIFSWFPWQFVETIFHSLYLNLCLAFT